MAIWYMQNDVPFERTSLDLYESSIIQMTMSFFVDIFIMIRTTNYLILSLLSFSKRQYLEFVVVNKDHVRSYFWERKI